MLDPRKLSDFTSVTWVVECFDCEHLDTYGGDEFVQMGIDHAEETGHHVKVWLRSGYCDLKRDPASTAGDERA